MHADADVETEPALLSLRAAPAPGLHRDLQGRLARAPGVVLARLRVAVDEHHAVGERARDDAAGARRELREHGVFDATEVVVFLDVERGGAEARERDSAADDRHLTAFRFLGVRRIGDRR